MTCITMVTIKSARVISFAHNSYRSSKKKLIKQRNIGRYRDIKVKKGSKESRKKKREKVLIPHQKYKTKQIILWLAFLLVCVPQNWYSYKFISRANHTYYGRSDSKHRITNEMVLSLWQ